MYRNLQEFYKSKEWEEFREIVIQERVRDDGFVYDEVTGRPILRMYDMILHHKEFLTEDNVHDCMVSLNPDNIMIVSHKTHNQLHNKFGYVRKEIYLVYGPPLAGKTTWVLENTCEGDLIVDMDSIWQCVSGCERYIKPGKLNAVVFGMRDYLMDSVKIRRGKWDNAYIVGGYPLISERERICKQCGAREIYIESTKEECLARLEACEDRRDKKEWTKYIEEWWRRYKGGIQP